jgi:regulator of protease activity HflC (stomatin/prohibitin superfamily)
MTTNTKHNKRFPIKGFMIGCSGLFLIIMILTLLIVGIYVRSLFITIGPDEVAVVITPYNSMGLGEMPLTPGIHMLRPLEEVKIYKDAKQVYLSSTTMNCNCGPIDAGPVAFRTKDDIDIIMDYQITYSIDPKQVLNLHHSWQDRYQDDFVIPRSKKITQEIANQYTSNEISLTKRDEIEEKIFSQLGADFTDTFLILYKFKIVDVRLNK